MTSVFFSLSLSPLPSLSPSLCPSSSLSLTHTGLFHSCPTSLHSSHGQLSEALKDSLVVPRQDCSCSSGHIWSHCHDARHYSGHHSGTQCKGIQNGIQLSCYPMYLATSKSEASNGSLYFTLHYAEVFTLDLNVARCLLHVHTLFFRSPLVHEPLLLLVSLFS